MRVRPIQDVRCQAWLASMLDEAHLAQRTVLRFRSYGNQDPRVVLSLFFGQSDACITSKELRHDVRIESAGRKGPDRDRKFPRDGRVFYIFHKNYHGVNREKFAKVYTDLPTSAAGRQLATLFQFGNLTLRDGSCLAAALSLLEASERAARRRQGAKRLTERLTWRTTSPRSAQQAGPVRGVVCSP